MTFPPDNELAWQARWISGELGNIFFTEEGRRIVIHFPGEWNREPGPDFRKARISIEGCDVVLTGDIEFDPCVSDWEAHGHATNPDFENVILHVFLRRSRNFYFTKTNGFRHVPQVCLYSQPIPREMPKKETLSSLPIPLTHAIPLLEDAAMRRMRRKTDLLQRRISIQGSDQALFQSLATAMGYKRNALPFTLLAQRATLRRIRESNGEALLFGLARFLEGERFHMYSRDTRKMVRPLWNDWWKLRSGLERWIFPSSFWRKGAQHPANHPHRRLAALYLSAQNWKPLRQSFESASSQQLKNFLLGLHHPYWDYHARLDGTPLRAATALIGSSRTVDILANIYYPWQATKGNKNWNDYLHLPSGQISTMVKHSAIQLVGEEYAGKLLRRTVWQQGLLELFENPPVTTPGRTFQ